MNNVECESCVKRKTMYCPNSFKCYATKDKPYWQNRIMLLEENNQLKEQYCERTDCGGRLGNSKKVERLENTIKELRSWLEELGHCDIFTSEILSKLNDLEGGKND